MQYDRGGLNLGLRVNIALGLVCLCFFAIGLRLWYLQVLKGDYFRDKSENNRLRSVYIAPPRGLIYDRHNAILAKNRPAFNIELIAEDSPDPEATISRLAQILGRDRLELISQLKGQSKRGPVEPKIIVQDISRDMLARVVARKHELPGIAISVTPTRQYIHGDLAAHLLGYIREIDRKQLKNPIYARYRMGDLIGQSGVEAEWERYIQGQRGVQEIIVNATGTRIALASFMPESAGNNVTLTIDLDVQRAADRALSDIRGAVVAMDPHTGEILALSSSPRFDPNVFAGPMTAAQSEELIGGEGKRLYNRATQGAYHPGSIFKIFVSVAMLAEGIMSPQETVHCSGAMDVGNRTFHCHKRSGHGAVNDRQGLIESCDVYFYTAGQRLGVDRIHDYAVSFGLGAATGLDLGDESPGLIPSTEWKRRFFKDPGQQKWYPGETPSVAIGQGAVTTTPLQIARGLSAVVNGGYVLKPYLVKKIESADGSFHDANFRPEIISKANVEQRVLDRVIGSMAGVVNDPRGTGKRAQLNSELGINAGGKTGTAQVVGAGHAQDSESLQDHAWFAGFAPVEKPEIVVAALVENGGHGGVVAAPVVKQVMEAYFYKRRALESESGYVD